MCGIAGIFSYDISAPSVSSDELLRIRDNMIHRGPDGSGIWLSKDKSVGLAHRRLAIIDPRPEGDQPMWTSDGNCVIIFNGEIYNYLELKNELQAQGFLFKTGTDTEVIINLYLRDGEKMCNKLRGMFSFAIFDLKKKRVFLARDSFGIKPLYFYDDGKTLRFASQVKALLAGNNIKVEPESAGHMGYWVWGYVPEPWTLYKGVVSLEPGSWLSIEYGGNKKTGQFETVKEMITGQFSKNSQSLTKESSYGGSIDDNSHYSSLREAIMDSVKHHLISDVPVGVFLSAGIDSSTLVAIASEFKSNIHTVTLGFKEYEGTDSDETILAKKIAQKYGSQHSTIWIDRDDFESDLSGFLNSMDQPSTDGVNTWLIARAASQLGLKVAISGLGGDEFFGGYPSFHQIPRIVSLAKLFQNQPKIGRFIRKASKPLLQHFTSVKYASIFEYGASWEGAYLLRRATRMPWELDLLLNSDQYGTKYSKEFISDGLKKITETLSSNIELDDFKNPHAVISYLESTHYMRSQLLRDTDWAGMAHSVEIRVPIVDKNFLTFIYDGSNAFNSKIYLKKDLANCANPPLFQDILSRPKTGFTVPVKKWIMRNNLKIKQQHGQRDWQNYVMTNFYKSV